VKESFLPQSVSHANRERVLTKQLVVALQKLRKAEDSRVSLVVALPLVFLCLNVGRPSCWLNRDDDFDANGNFRDIKLIMSTGRVLEGARLRFKIGDRKREDQTKWNVSKWYHGYSDRTPIEVETISFFLRFCQTFDPFYEVDLSTALQAAGKRKDKRICFKTLDAMVISNGPANRPDRQETRHRSHVSRSCTDDLRYLARAEPLFLRWIN
jgi:hypothetical protein